MTEISPKLRSGKFSTPVKSLGEAVSLHFGREIEYLEKCIHKSQKNLFLYSFFLPQKFAVDVLFQYCPVSNQKQRSFNDLKITFMSLEDLKIIFVSFGIFSKLSSFCPQDKKSCKINSGSCYSTSFESKV